VADEKLRMELGIFEVKETVINNPDGSTTIKKTPKVTGKGQVYFINHFLAGKSLTALSK
jgi:anti-repressor protein